MAKKPEEVQNGIPGLFTDGKPNWDKPESVQWILIRNIKKFPENVRTAASIERMQALVKDVGDHGIQVPLLIARNTRGATTLHGGHRRIRAAKENEHRYVPCRLDPKRYSTEDALIEVVRDNCWSEDPPPVDLGECLYKVKQVHSLNSFEVGALFDLEQPQVDRYLSLRRLRGKARKLVNSGAISFNLGYYLSRIETSADQEAMANSYMDGERTAEDVIEQIRRGGVSSRRRKKKTGSNRSVNTREISVREKETKIILKGRRTYTDEMAAEVLQRALSQLQVPMEQSS